jgi:hypothetical protein
MAHCDCCVSGFVACVSLNNNRKPVMYLTEFRRTCASSIYTATYDQLMKEFGSSREVVTLGLSLFVFGLAVGPMVLSPLSEVS